MLPALAAVLGIKEISLTSAIVLPALAAASGFAVAAVTIPQTSYSMGYNYIRGTSAGFATFVDNKGQTGGGSAPFARRYQHWWY